MKNLNVAGLMMIALATACGPSPDPVPPTTGASSSSGGTSTSSSSSSGGHQCDAVMCTLYCESGFQAGADGCPTCACNNTSSSSSGGSTSSSGGPTCSAIACFAACPFGFRADAQGCPTCECLPGACGSIGDENLCRNTAGCEPVFFNDQGSSSGGIGCGMGAPPVMAGFECCTQTPEGVFCDGLPPPPPQDCREFGCAPGFACQGEQACPVSDCACAQDVPCDCGIPPPCEAIFQCVPVNTGDCRTYGCAAGETCQAQPVCEIACDCDPSTDFNCGCPPCAFESWACVPGNDPCAAALCGPGTVCQVAEVCSGGGDCGCASDSPTCDCAAPRCEQVVQCVPVTTGDCREFGCAAGEACQPQPVCLVAQCECDPTALDCVCPPPPPCAFERWACEPASDLCATVRCGGGTVCQVVEACTGGGFCGCPAGDPTCACDAPACQLIAQCVPAGNDCRVNGCAAGQACLEATVCSGGVGCACPAGQPCDCGEPTPGTCTTTFECVAGNPDPCAQLTEDQCALDADLCTPQYASECPPCADPTTCGNCMARYMGCASIQGSTDAGPPRMP